MNPDFVLRPVREDDHGPLAGLIKSISGGITTLPDNPDYLSHRINDSLRAFDHRVRKPGGESYLFVMEDARSGALVGTSGLLSRVGGFDPFYTYRIVRRIQQYEPLGIRNELQTLELVRSHKGPTEICSLYLHPDCRRHGLGQLLSLARFCFIKAHPERFDERIIAELRGYLDEAGRSPFWEAVGKQFFQRDYYTADVLTGIGEKDFIEALMPEFPIYINLLPESARAVIGRVHPHTEPARRILLKQGFEETDEVDIFDAGPILRARREDLRAWRAARAVKARVSSHLPAGAHPALLANRSLAFRATMADAALHAGEVTVTPRTADALCVQDGADLFCMTLQDEK